MAPATLSYSETTDIDRRMLAHELWASLAHLLMLCACGILDEGRGREIAAELLRMMDQAEHGDFKLDPALEDVHLNVESRLIERLGLDIGGRLHMGRSRNDQVVTDSRLYVRDALLAIGRLLIGLVSALLDRAEEQAGTLTLGYTHSQAAQPITFGFWLSAHASALLRDLKRLSDALETVNLCPLGSGALAGTSFPIDRRLTCALLGFDDILRHALDATSTRDYMLETASVCATCMAQLSRLAEEIVVWSSSATSGLKVSDAYTTGSSIMPQKRNPVVAELARAKSATAFGALMEILSVTKSVTMGYSSDLQQDKPPIWRALDVTSETIGAFTGLIATLEFETKNAEDACWRSFATATELANYLTSTQQRPFREAYDLVGRLVRHLESHAMTFRDANVSVAWLAANGVKMPLEEFVSSVDPRRAVERQTSTGGTSPEEVRATIVALRDQLGRNEARLTDVARRSELALAKTRNLATSFLKSELSGVELSREILAS